MRGGQLMRAKLGWVAVVCAWEWKGVMGRAVSLKLTAVQQLLTCLNVHGLPSISSFLTVTLWC